MTSAMIRQMFEAMNLAARGEPVGVVLPATQDMLCATICIASDSQQAALDLAARVHQDVLATIRKNYGHYRSQLSTGARVGT